MGEALDIRLDPVGVARLQAAMDQTQWQLRKGAANTLRWGAWNLARSLGAATKSAPKLRPIVKNPDKRAGRDARVARYGVWRWKPDGRKVFRPIGATGEFGKIRYIDKKTLMTMERDRVTGKVKRTTFTSEDPGASERMIAHDKRRIIKRRGLAKAAWMWSLAKFGRRGSMGHADAATAAIAARNVETESRLKTSSDNMMIRISNKLRYAVAALKGGGSAVSSAAERAARSMEYKLATSTFKKGAFS